MCTNFFFPSELSVSSKGKEPGNKLDFSKFSFYLFSVILCTVRKQLELTEKRQLYPCGEIAALSTWSLCGRNGELADKTRDGKVLKTSGAMWLRK